MQISTTTYGTANLRAHIKELRAWFELRGCEPIAPRFPQPMRDAYELLVKRDGQRLGKVHVYGRSGNANTDVQLADFPDAQCTHEYRFECYCCRLQRCNCGYEITLDARSQFMSEEEYCIKSAVWHCARCKDQGHDELPEPVCVHKDVPRL